MVIPLAALDHVPLRDPSFGLTRDVVMDTAFLPYVLAWVTALLPYEATPLACWTAANLVATSPHFVPIAEHVRVLREMLLDWSLGQHLLLLGEQGVGKNKLADKLLSLLCAERE